ncbi:MAG: hypothetical protein ABSE62_10540 [Chthoniobacteraceae bacterium]
MSPFAVVLLACNGIFLLCCSRRQAVIPLMLGCCYITDGQRFYVGTLMFDTVRTLITLGYLRLMIKGERPSGGLNKLDMIFLLGSLWLLFASLFHQDVEGSGPKYASSVILCTTGSYFLFRSFIQSKEDIEFAIKAVAVILLPVALEMLFEKATGTNLFSIFGAVPQVVAARGVRLRAQGPFSHPILAGTIGAIAVPAFFGIWRSSRKFALCGIFAGVSMVVASASSGPILTLAAGVFALAWWRFRALTGALRWSALLGYLLLAMLMNKAPYFLIARIDVAGGSTGHYRAQLIYSAIQHIKEWWLIGTDYTRNWMPDNPGITDNMADITNAYIMAGIMGGLASLFFFLAAFKAAFSFVGAAVRQSAEIFDEEDRTDWLAWCLGAGLCANVVTGFAVTYFGQSYLFLYLNFALISVLYDYCRGLKWQMSPEDNSEILSHVPTGISGFRPIKDVNPP